MIDYSIVDGALHTRIWGAHVGQHETSTNEMNSIVVSLQQDVFPDVGVESGICLLGL